MKVVALVSGGKDSCYNMMQCVAAGHQIVALANLRPANGEELNSHMYQSVAHEAIELMAEAMDVPLFQAETQGISKQTSMEYQPTENDEIEDLYNLLLKVKEEVQVDAVASGAVLSDYQRIRIENVCIRLGLVSLAYLWQRKQAELLEEMIKCEVDAIIVRVAAIGLEPQRHLGRSIRLIEPHLLAMHEKYGINVCGEGGEYETLTLDCPLFRSRIVIEESEIVLDSDDPIAPTGYMKLKKIKLELKLPQLDLNARFANLPLKNPNEHVQILDQPDDSPVTNDLGVKGDCTLSDAVENADITQSEHVSVSGSGWLYLGGLTAIVTDNNPAEAFEKAMAKLKCLLLENNHRLEDLCSISMYVADMSQYAELNRIYCETLNHFNPPTRACVQVPLPANCPVVIEAISFSGRSMLAGDANAERSTMHVQSLSHWCPANIGPYSQACRIGELINLAGQISLVPGSMVMINGGIKSQCQLALRHVERLLKAIGKSDLRDVVQGICYLSDQKYVEHARSLWEEETNNAIVDYVVVSGLPRNALVEWHVWAHKHNNQFEYEETGQCVQDWSISIFRRWNYENNIATILCHVSNTDANTVLSAAIFRETIEYVLQKLNHGHEYDPKTICSVKVFYPVNKNICAYSFVSILEEFRRTVPVVHTIVPVVALHHKNTFLSICGVRTQ